MEKGQVIHPWVLSRSSEKRLFFPKPIDSLLILPGNTLQPTCHLIGFVATALPQLPPWISGWKAWSRSESPRPLDLADPCCSPGVAAHPWPPAARQSWLALYRVPKGLAGLPPGWRVNEGATGPGNRARQPGQATGQGQSSSFS